MTELLDRSLRLRDSEGARLDALAHYRIAGTPPEARFDSIAQLATNLFDTPIALVSLIDRDRQWFKANVGLGMLESPREISFCRHTIASDDVFIVNDAAVDPDFADNPLVTGGPAIRFYAGAPLITPTGHRLGAFCIADNRPRDTFSSRDRKTLQDLAGLAMQQIELRRDELVRAAVMRFADASTLPLISIDGDGTIVFVNPAAASLFGYTPDEVSGQPIQGLISASPALDGSGHASAGPISGTGHCRDGSELPVQLSFIAWQADAAGAAGGTGYIIRDLSHRRERRARRLHLASHDALTGLANRSEFEARLQETLQHDNGATVLLLNLDGIKEINDSLGRAVGDALIQDVAARLPALIDADATLARFGGASFAVLLPQAHDSITAWSGALTILQSFEQPFDFDGHAVPLGVSIGAAVGPEHGDDARTLIASADFALFQAKQSGGRTVRIFDTEMRTSSLARRVTQDELGLALQNRELVLHYQPQVSLVDRHVIGMEALIRWQHPQRGLLQAGEFLSALETSEAALPIGWWVLDEACRQLARWRAAGLPIRRIAVNLFSVQLLSGNLVEQVMQTLEHHGLEPGMLELEVTETIALYHDDESLASISDLRRQGIGIAFDDFGTGYASLSTLRRFPLSSIKIDRCFVRDLLVSRRDRVITTALISLGADLGLEIIAEGIETAEQEAALRTLGCKAGQGYRYGRPTDTDTATELLEQQRLA
jgi:diguanylate cyclase (GGDEF)-like protein/PAS domain S-box-containing protein